jgi:uncharacterized protein involved in exopolysaccharide biosynthesis
MTAAQPYVAVSRRALDLEDYISVARRHVGWIAGPTFAGLVVSIVVVCCLPNVYEAKAVMQIQPSSISESLIQSTTSQQLNERIQQMKTNIESRQSLAAIINDPRLNLYKEERNKEPLEDVEDEMRAAIQITTNPDSVTRKGASVFSIVFRYKTKKGAQDTVNTLITKFIDESSSSQRDQQTTISEFFGDELNQAKANLEKQQEALTKFRKENDGRLPEQEASNLESLRSLGTQISSINQDLNRLANERVQLEAQVTTLDNQLKLSASLAEEADSIPAPTSVVARQNDDLAAVNKQIDSLQLQLQMQKQTYKPNTPEIRGSERSLKTLQERRDQILADQTKRQADEAAQTKPAAQKKTNYTALARQEGLQGEIRKFQALLHNNETDRDLRLKQLETATRQSEDYRSRLTATYTLQAPYLDLRRDYDAAAEKYEKYQKQKDLTSQSAALIERRATEYLSLLDAPTIPQKPVSPQRPLIIGGGFALSLVLGFALAGLQEARDASLKNLKDVRAYTNLPVLCSIPLLENTLLVKRKRRITALAWSAAVIVGLMAVGGAFFYYSSVISNT